MVSRQWRSILEAVESFAIIGAAIAIVFVLFTDRSTSAGGATATLPASPAATLDISAQRLRLVLDPAMVVGSATASIALIEFADFQCPYCANFHADSLPKLRAEFVDTGKVRFAYKHFPIEEIHPLARQAADQAACAAKQGHFWPVHDALFAARGKLSPQLLASVPREAKLDERAFNDCLGLIGAVVDVDVADARRLSVNSTPTFFLGRIAKGSNRVELVTRIAGARPFDAFADAIEALEKAK